MITYKDLAKKLPLEMFNHSAVMKDNLFAKIISDIKPKIAVEIGTYFGVSTTILASICDNVYTFDVKFYPETSKIWDLFKVKNKIVYMLVTSTDETKYILKHTNFDFAFIDSVHKYEDAKRDFNIVKKCGNVLFHDNNDNFPGIKKFCSEIGCTKIGDFGHWKK